MSFKKQAGRIGLNQARNLRNLICGLPLTRPSLGSVTLDMDDVEIARKKLKDRAGWSNNTKVVSEFESEFASWNGSSHAFAFMGGRVALSACIAALKLRPGDEVILPGYTCVVVPNAFRFAGIKTVYCDIELDTYGLDASGIEEKITDKTRAILLHHLYGLVCRDYEEIIRIAKKHDLKVIEDCAQSTGAEYKGVKVGNLGDVSFYSSEQSKVFNTVQGGLAATNDNGIAEGLEEFYQKASCPDEDSTDRLMHTLILNYYRFKHHQRWWTGDITNLIHGEKRIISTTEEEEKGIKPAHYGRRMPAPIAEIGLNQLKKIDLYNNLRRQSAARWDKWCETNGYDKPLVVEGSLPIFLRYPVMVEPDKKRDTSWALKDEGVNVGVWFVSNIHPAQERVDGCPNADRAVECCINFPSVL